MHIKKYKAGLSILPLAAKTCDQILFADSVSIGTELAKELTLYQSLIKEQYKSEAYALEYIRNVKNTRDKLNQSVLKRQRYNLVKEISKNFVFEDISKIRINNYDSN